MLTILDTIGFRMFIEASYQGEGGAQSQPYLNLTIRRFVVYLSKFPVQNNKSVSIMILPNFEAITALVRSSLSRALEYSTTQAWNDESLLAAIANL